MKPLTMFQRSVLMYMHQSEVMEGDRFMWFSRKAFEFAFMFGWQSHHTKAMRELVQSRWIESRKKWGIVEYQLTDIARSQFDTHRQHARRHARVAEMQRVLIAE